MSPRPAGSSLSANHITGARGSARINTALVIVAALCGEAIAKEIQLNMEYAPDPPFNSGHADTTDADLLARVRADMEPRLEARRQIATRAVADFAHTVT